MTPQTRTTRKFKLYYPHKPEGGQCGMNPLTHAKGRWKGKPITFNSREEAEKLAKENGWNKALAIPVN